MKIILAFLAGGIICGAWVATALWYLDLPTKVVSNATGECLFVLTPEGKRDCDYLTEGDRYITRFAP